VDFFAIYLVPIDRGYIIPFAAASKTSVSLQFTPQKQGHKYECYLEACTCCGSSWQFRCAQNATKIGRAPDKQIYGGSIA
jgi:hypothetical protein